MAQRVYSAEEVDAFLHFVCLDKTLFGTPRNEAPEWWPCLLFQNMSELRDVTKQLDMVRDTASQREILLLCMRNLPQSLSCKVALLLGDRPPVRFILDATSGSLTAKPFLLDFLPLGDKNKNDKDFMQALCAVAPFLNAAVDSAKAAKDAGVENQFDSPDAKPAAKEAVVVREEEAAVSRCENARACQDASLNVGAGSASAPSPSLAPSPKRPAEVEASATSEASNQMQWTETADPMDEASISHVDQTLETETERGNDGPGESNEAVDPSFPNDLLPPNSLAAEKTTVNNAVASVFTVQNPRSGSSLESTESSTPQIRNKTKNNNYPSGDAGAERPLTSIAPQDEVETLRHATGSMQTPIAGNNNNNGHVKKTAASISSTGSLDTATRKKKVGRGKNNKSTSCKKRKRAPSTNTESSSKMKKESPFEIVEIPTFADVQPIFERGGYTFKDSKYCRPRQSAPVATTEAEFRKDLCAYGVNCRCGNTEENQACACWSEDDKWIIMLWVRYAVIRGSPPSDKVLLINPITARSYLYRLGFTHLNTQLIDGYVFPGMTTAKDGTISRSLNELWKFLSQFGLPEYCDYEKLTADKRFSLEYFVSTNEFRANTFTYLPKANAGETLSGEPYAVSPALGRTTRSHQNVNSHDSGDAVTVVSTVSEQSALAPGKNWLKNAPRKTSLDSQKYIVESRSSMNETASHLSVCTAPSPQAAQRVSLSPLNASVKLTLPEFKGTDREKLRACLDSLKTASHANRPTFSNSKTSKFASNIRTVSSFLFAVIDSNGEYGGEDGDPAALYVCGAPGLGKTSGVTWCCDNAIASCKANTPEPKICHINAACLASEPNPLQYLLNELGEVVGIKARNPTTATIFRMLQRVKGKPKRTQVILVVDEIDALVSNNDGLSSKEVLLRTILEWVNNPDMQMALIGISNCINDDNTSRILEAGSFKDTVIFSTYSEEEIQQILEARVGRSVIAPSVLVYIAKKVASSTGDARKALEMAANTVQHRLERTNIKDSNVGTIVTMADAVHANKEEMFNLKERIDGQPVAGKVILSVLTAYAQAGVVDSTIGELKQCVSDCLRGNGAEDEMLQMEDFLVLLETLVDNGLLRASAESQRGDGFRLVGRRLSEVHHQPIRLGIQLEESEKVLEDNLKESYYQTLRENAKKKRGNQNLRSII